MFFSLTTAFFGLALVSRVSAATYDITVGSANGTLAFTPEAIAANPGDQVTFHFEQKNHSVTQSSFANPCGLKEGGFDSGFMPVPANQTDNFPTFTINVNDTNPIWVFCDQFAALPTSHCGAGMVFAINCGADGSPNSFTNFKAAALAHGAALKAAASSASAAATETAAATTTYTAAYGDATVPPPETATLVTETVTLDSSTWTTTYSSYPGSAAPTPNSLEGTVHTIIVGGNSTLTFDPPSIQAAPNDIVMFEFHSKNHTATQSAFNSPCLKLNNISAGITGFDSGFMPVVANSTDFPSFNYTVVDTQPVWGYCRQKTPTSHCGAGMVFSINAVESSAHSFEAFQQLAEQLNGTASASAGASATAGSSGASASATGAANSGALGNFFASRTTVALGAVAAAFVLVL